ncbi:response regulator transcription factor [Paenibacillus antri]|uniref:Response regulator transcription factor n=1 Tax=Paenibacillus antri TaxID=2582848 RepID=A0A5R9FYU5_9BACL|nr:response regulator [Paenibacillus antri]TLS49227.1 response regulator transcription factor [Paenibacillus antri]
MYDVLIVDDEPVARESLRYLIDWEEQGFAIRSEAANGLQALELLKERHYALVLTDIRMPTMNGLDLIARMKEVTDCPVVILSGYDDFEYARQGLKLGAKEYLLKPVDEDELIATLRRTAEELEERRFAERRHRLGLSAMRDQLLRRLAHGAVGRKEFEEQRALVGFPPRIEETFACLVVEMDFVYGGGKEGEGLSEKDTELKRYAVRNICEELAAGEGFVFEDAEDRYGVLFYAGAASTEPAALRARAERIAASTALYAKETVSVGVGACARGFATVRESFREAEEALDRKFLTGAGAVLSVRGEGEGANGADGEGEVGGAGDELFRSITAHLLDAVRHFRREDAEASLARLWDGFRASGATAQRAKPVVIELFVQLARIARETGASQELLFDRAFGDYEAILRVKTIEELRRLTERKCEAVLVALASLGELRPNKVIEELKSIVQARYMDDVSLRGVAQRIYMNPNYLGKLFKANTGMSFNDYLLQVRMEKAKELLLHSDLKVYEISEAVGYGELDWFYKRFKAYTGISASEFRSGGELRYGK